MTQVNPTIETHGEWYFPGAKKKWRVSSISNNEACFYETPYTSVAWEEYFEFKPTEACIGKGISLPLQEGKAYSHEAITAACESIYA